MKNTRIFSTYLIRKVFVPLSLICSLGSVNANAAEVVINDCAGLTRAQTQLNSDSNLTNLEVILDSETSKTDQFLLLTDGSIETSAKIIDGGAYFENVKSGSYKLCNKTGDAKISEVILSSSNNTASTSTVSLIGASSAVVGGTLLALNTGGSSGSDSTSSGISAQNNLAGESQSLPLTSGSSKPQISDRASDRDCLNGAKVNPLSPFE